VIAGRYANSSQIAKTFGINYLRLYYVENERCFSNLRLLILHSLQILKPHKIWDTFKALKNCKPCSSSFSEHWTLSRSSDIVGPSTSMLLGPAYNFSDRMDLNLESRGLHSRSSRYRWKTPSTWRLCSSRVLLSSTKTKHWKKYFKWKLISVG
jgi:hypothetical protein